MAINFRLENSRVRGKRKSCDAVERVRCFGSFMCYKKKKFTGEILTEGLHSRSINFYKVKQKGGFIFLTFVRRRMKQNQKTAFLMSRAMKAHESSWPMPRPKGCGCRWEKKSKSCSVRLEIFRVSSDLRVGTCLPRGGQNACGRATRSSRLASCWWKSHRYLGGWNSAVFCGRSA